MDGMSSDFFFDYASSLPQFSGNERKIGLFNNAFGKLPRQFPMRLIIFRDHKTAACFFIQAMNNAWPFFPADSRKASAMAEQRIDQGVLAMASARMNDKPGWFIDHDEIIVLEENLERNRLRLTLDLFEWRLG